MVTRRGRGLGRGVMLTAGLAISGGILGCLVFGNLRGILRVAEGVDWRFVAAMVACSIASYVMIGLALWEVLGLLGHRLSFPEVLGIAFVATTANYVVSSVGVSGFALKAHLLHKRRVPYGTTLTASVVTTVLMYFVLGIIITQGLAYLFLRSQGQKFQIMEGLLGLGVLLVTSVPILLFFLDRELRGRFAHTAFRWVNHIAYFFSKREIPREDFEAFQGQLDRGLARIREQKGRLTLAIVYTCLDWGFTMAVLYFGFQAVGVPIGVGHLSTGFAVGQASTLIPVLPGGLGAMEGGMAATFQSLGVPWDDAMVAALLYRMAYYLLPGLCSVFLLWGLKVSEPKLIGATAAGGVPDEGGSPT